MSPKQYDHVREAIKCIQTARKWLDMATYYSGSELQEDEFIKIRNVFDLLCKAENKL